MTRHIDQDSLEALKRREGCRLVAYNDDGGSGVWTIGYGDTKDVKPGMVITQQEADARLELRLPEFEQCVEQSVHVPLTEAQFGALVSFCYNIGVDAFASSTLVKKLNAGDYASVPAEMLRWVNVRGVRSEGLINRRNSEGGQWVKGAYVAGVPITPDQPPPWHKQPIVRKLGAAVATAASSVTADSIKSASDAASNAASLWHGFSTVAAILSAALIGWALFEHRKAN